MRSMWKGSITFGLVAVPVSLYKATEEHAGLSLHQVHEKDGGRIKLRRFCEIEDIEVPYAEITRGYEADDGREAVLTKDDLADLPLPSKKIIDVLGFVDAADIDPLRLSSAYYVGVAAKSPAKPYVLLRDALTESGQVAITKVTLSTRESLAVLRVVGELIVLQTLLWPDEIREPDGLAPKGESDIRPQELKMAKSLMDTLSEDFDLNSLHDEYSQALQQVIDAKLDGAPITSEQPASTDSAKVLDLMAALKSSVEAAQRSHAKASEGNTEPKKSAAKATARKTTPAGAAVKKTLADKTPAKKTAAKKTTARKAS